MPVGPSKASNNGAGIAKSAKVRMDESVSALTDSKQFQA